MSIVITVKVVPSAKKQKILQEVNGTLKLYITAPPVDGKANEALIAFFAKQLKIPKKSVLILSGATTRIKRIALETTITHTQLYQALGIEQQLSLI